MKETLARAILLMILGSGPAHAACNAESQARRDAWLSQVPGFGIHLRSRIADYVPASFGDSLAELQYYWRFRETPQDDDAITSASGLDTYATLQTYSHSWEMGRYSAAPEFMLKLIDELRSNRARANDADWWLDGGEDFPKLDLAHWLQGMAASDHWHRAHDRRHRYRLRALLTSWATYDPWTWDVDGYRAVTDDALRRWDERDDPLWGVLAYARIHPAHPRVPELIGRFERLHHRVVACEADRSETLAYPPMRFHALRLMTMRAKRRQNRSVDRSVNWGRTPIPHDKTLWPRMLALLDTPIAPNEDRYLKERITAYLATLPNPRVPLKVLLQKAPWLEKDYHWLTATTLDDFIDGLNAHDGALPDHFTSRWTYYDVKARAWNFIDAFSSEALLYIAARLTSAQAREKMAGVVFVRGFALDDWSLQERAARLLERSDGAPGTAAARLLAAPAKDRDWRALLMIIDAKDTIDIRWNRGAGYTQGKAPFWCRMVIDEAAQTQLFNRVWNGWTIKALGPRPRLYLQRWRKSGGVPDMHDYDEMRRLAALPSAPELFMRRAAAAAARENTWSQRKLARIGLGPDARIGEMLHRAILFSKSRCNGRYDPEAGRAAWRELQRNPAWEAWAAKTPYWYGGKLQRGH